MSAKRHDRTLARRYAVQALYQSEILDKPVMQVVGDETAIAEGGPLPSYTVDLLQAVEVNRIEIDGRIKRSSENWALDRMPMVDRAILRLAVCEMAFVDDVPVSVAINEAVDLAKDFGGEDESPRFVNGVLGRIAHDIDAAGEVVPPAGETVSSEDGVSDECASDADEGATDAGER